jgi:hypothetical protein
MKTELYDIHISYIQGLVESAIDDIKTELKEENISKQPQNKNVYQRKLAEAHDVLKVINPILNIDQGFIIISSSPVHKIYLLPPDEYEKQIKKIISPTMESELFDTHLGFIRGLIAKDIEETQIELEDKTLVDEEIQFQQYNLIREMEILDVICPIINKFYALGKNK